MRYLLLLPLLLLGCDRQGQAPSAPQVTQAQPASAYGHITPIQLPDNEIVHSFVAVGGSGFRDRYIVTKTTDRIPTVYTLRDEFGSPIVIVHDGKQR